MLNSDILMLLLDTLNHTYSVSQYIFSFSVTGVGVVYT